MRPTSRPSQLSRSHAVVGLPVREGATGALRAWPRRLLLALALLVAAAQFVVVVHRDIHTVPSQHVNCTICAVGHVYTPIPSVVVEFHAEPRNDAFIPRRLHIQVVQGVQRAGNPRDPPYDSSLPA